MYLGPEMFWYINVKVLVIAPPGAEIRRYIRESLFFSTTRMNYWRRCHKKC